MPSSLSFDVPRSPALSASIPQHPHERMRAERPSVSGSPPYLPPKNRELRPLPDLPRDDSPLLLSPRFFSAESLHPRASHDTLQPLRSPAGVVPSSPRSPLAPRAPSSPREPALQPADAASRAPVSHSPARSESSFSKKRWKHIFRTVKESLLPASLLRIDADEHTTGPYLTTQSRASLSRKPVPSFEQPRHSKSQLSLAQSSPQPLKGILRAATEPSDAPVSPRSPREPALRERSSAKSLRSKSASRDTLAPSGETPYPRRRTSSLAREGDAKRSPKTLLDVPPVPHVPSVYLGTDQRDSQHTGSSGDDLTPKASEFPQPPARIEATRPLRPAHRAPATPPPTAALPAIPMMLTTAEDFKRLSSNTSHKSEPSLTSALGLSTHSSATTPPLAESPPTLRPLRPKRSGDELREVARLLELDATHAQMQQQIEQLLVAHNQHAQAIGERPLEPARTRALVPWYEIGRAGDGQILYVFGNKKIWRDASSLGKLLPLIRPLARPHEPLGDTPQLHVRLCESDLDWLIEYTSYGQPGSYERDPGDTIEAASRKKITQLKRLRAAVQDCGTSLREAQAVIHDELFFEFERIYDKSLERARRSATAREIAAPLRDKIAVSLRQSAVSTSARAPQRHINIQHNYEIENLSHDELDRVFGRDISLLDATGPIAFLPGAVNTWLDSARQASVALSKWLYAADIDLANCVVKMQARNASVRISVDMVLPESDGRSAARSLQRMGSLRRAEAQRV